MAMNAYGHMPSLEEYRKVSRSYSFNPSRSAHDFEYSNYDKKKKQ